jgi:hypothetical protein
LVGSVSSFVLDQKSLFSAQLAQRYRDAPAALSTGQREESQSAVPRAAIVATPLAAG